MGDIRGIEDPGSTVNFDFRLQGVPFYSIQLFLNHIPDTNHLFAVRSVWIILHSYLKIFNILPDILPRIIGKIYPAFLYPFSIYQVK